MKVGSPHDRNNVQPGMFSGGKCVTKGYEDSEGMEQVEDWLCDESCPIRLLDEQSGIKSSGYRANPSTKRNQHQNTVYGKYQDEYTCGERGYVDQGGASRYFMRFSPFIYQAKASRAERSKGLDKAVKLRVDLTPATNTHPTVKPLALCRYLVRMITPPGGIVLDCFAGSGSTLVAAIHEGMHFIGIEMNDSEQEPYVTIARARIEQAFRDAGKPDAPVPPAEEWECAEDCPIAALDKQSGILHARGNKTPTKQGKGMFFPEGGYLSPINPGDQGGASRYFTNLVQDGMFDEVQS